MDDSEVTFNRHDVDDQEPERQEDHYESDSESEASLVTLRSDNGAGDGVNVTNSDRINTQMEHFRTEIKRILLQLTQPYPLLKQKCNH